MNPECKKQIRYVEDSTTSQWVLKQKLAKLADITNAVSLAEGRALLDRKHFDLVILDWSLPDGTSIRLISEIRAQYSTTQLPIILVSSSLDKIMTSQALQAGANECKVKPIAWAEFTELAKQMIEKPYVNDLVNSGAVVTWIEGYTNGQFWLYCPEANLLVRGNDADLVRQDATKQLERLLLHSAVLEPSREIRTSTHYIVRPQKM